MMTGVDTRWSSLNSTLGSGIGTPHGSRRYIDLPPCLGPRCYCGGGQSGSRGTIIQSEQVRRIGPYMDVSMRPSIIPCMWIGVLGFAMVHHPHLTLSSRDQPLQHVLTLMGYIKSAGRKRVPLPIPKSAGSRMPIDTRLPKRYRYHTAPTSTRFTHEGKAISSRFQIHGSFLLVLIHPSSGEDRCRSSGALPYTPCVSTSRSTWLPINPFVCGWCSKLLISC